MRFFLNIIYIMVLMSLFWLAPARAVVIHGLNSADLIVPDRTKATLQVELPQALSQVLIKQSGNPSIMTVPAVQNALSSVMQLVQSYAYTTTTDDSGNSQLHLHVVFDRSAVLNLLRQAGQAIWNGDRPLTLLWINVSDDNPYNILSNSTNATLGNQVLQTAKTRGLPVLLPMMDLQDQQYVNTNSAQAFSADQLQAAAKRYDAQAILAATVSMNFTNGWKANWLLLLNGQPYAWSSSADTKSDLLDTGVNTAANMIANQYAVLDSSALQSAVLLEVLGVNNLKDYIRLLHYLNRLSSVSQVKVVNLSGSIALLQINVVGGQQALVRLLNTEQQLAAIPAPLSEGVNRADLYYRLLH